MLGEILAVIVSTREDESVLAGAALLQAAHGCAVSAIQFVPAQEPIEGAGAVDAGILTLRRELSGRVTALEDEAQRLARRLRDMPAPFALRSVEAACAMSAERAGVEARRADLTVLLQPRRTRDESVRRAILEGVLFRSARPVLVMPAAWRAATLARTVLIAWNGSREAARALADAHPLIERAARVMVCEVDESGEAAMPAGAVVAHLRRSGIACDYRAIRRRGVEVYAILIQEGEAIGADLIVMGGYGHARIQEMLFGGVTRSMLRQSPFPLLMSR